VTAGRSEPHFIADDIRPVFDEYFELEQAGFGWALLVSITLKIRFQRDFHLLKTGKTIKFTLKVLKHAVCSCVVGLVHNMNEWDVYVQWR
jgi:hypothetical protein